MKNKLILLNSALDTLGFDLETARLVSYRRRSEPDQEFISFSKDHPAFIIGYYDSNKRYDHLYSNQADKIDVNLEDHNEGKKLKAVYSRIGGFDITVSLNVIASEEDPFIHWNVCVSNLDGPKITDIQYPFIVCNYDLGGESGTEAILLPHGYGSGRLITSPGIKKSGSNDLREDSKDIWEFSSRNGDCNHYPGMQFAQFMAYYNDRAGLYIACQDKDANIKRFAALNREPGIRFGVSHVGDWPTDGERRLEYDVVTRSFTGDWYDAADIYREWSLQQKWFVPLYRRNDVPKWLLDSPVYITIRPQGYVDDGEIFPVREFLPYEKCIPLLEKISNKVRSPLAVILMGWEHAGPWVQPESFPPIGGEDSMRSFIKALRERGWHAGTFCSGTRWVMEHKWNSYDGIDYFKKNNGEASVCRGADGSPWRENWDSSWRPSYACCLGADKTREICVGYVRHLIDWGMESIQFLDQNNGSSTFPCFSEDHGHPPMPGKWMSEKMHQLMEEFLDAARGAGEYDVIHSAESGLNEICMPLFQQTELRTFPPCYGSDVIPLYQYLFHECVILQGMMGSAPEPYHLVIKNAVNCVLGGIPGGVMTGDGTLLDKDTSNWAEWEPRVEDSDNAFKLIHNVTALRQGEGKDFLVYGRMLKPADISGIKNHEWSFNRRSNSIPSVLHSRWQAPDGRIGIVLCNWTIETAVICINSNHSCEVPPLNCILVIEKENKYERQTNT